MPMHFPVVRASALWAIISFCLIVNCLAEQVEITAEGTPSQSSEWNGGEFPAANAVDGDPVTFSHSDRDTPNNAWRLDFSADREISRVEIDMRTDCCAGRLSGTMLRLFDAEGDSVYVALITDPGPGQSLAFDLPTGLAGRSVRIGFENGSTNPGLESTLVHLGEVRVFADIDLLPSVDSFVATPPEIPAGDSSTLSWQVGDADRVELLGTGPVAAIGSAGVSPIDSHLYTLVASNAHGSRTASVAVLVDGVRLPPRINEFMASNSSTVVRSDGSTPDWVEIWNPNPVAIDLMAS